MNVKSSERKDTVQSSTTFECEAEMSDNAPNKTCNQRA
jgi:hypothetical protein